jgi:hypothetical protein
MSGASGALLTIPLCLREIDLTPGLGLVRAHTPIRHLANIRLVHQAHIDLNFKDVSWQINRANLISGHITY